MGEIPSLGTAAAAPRTDGDPRRRQEQRYPRRQPPRRPPAEPPEEPAATDERPTVGSRLNVTA